MQRPLRVIVVEDDDDDANLLVRELKRSFDPRYELVTTAAALREALQRESWDIVISDWSLPAFNGLDAFRIVRQIDRDLPFIIVSGTIAEENAVEALRAGVQDFMSKGRFARLAPAIERELREAETRRQKRLAEADLERQRAETERSERLLRNVLQSVPDGVIVVDADGQVVVWGGGIDEIVRLPRASIPLSEWPSYYGVHLADQTTVEPYSECVLARALAGIEVDREERFLRNAAVPKGIWLSVSGRPLRAGDGSITGAVAVYRDVSREKTAQEQLMISDRMASVGMLAAGVAHEINNPLGAALLNLEIVHELMAAAPAKRNEHELEEAMADARSAVARVREIVADLRIFSRHEDPSAVRADVRRALESSARMAWSEIRHRARVVKDYHSAPLVDGSEARLGQVFLNLIVNAAQAIPEGHVDKHMIRLSTRTDERGMAIVEVSDTGAGIGPDALSSLFSPFYTTKPPGIGTGLGLPICQRIVSQLGGKIEVESELGKGATFRVVLPPARRSDVAPAPVAIASRPPLSHRRGKVLVVDDEPMLGSAIRRVLSSQHDVVTTTRAVDALEHLRSGATFDVIFSDLMMPQVTGMELFQRISKEFPEQAQRMVFLTGGAFTQAARDFLAKVPNRTLEKPIDRNGLLALVNERVKAPGS